MKAYIAFLVSTLLVTAYSLPVDNKKDDKMTKQDKVHAPEKREAPLPHHINKRAVADCSIDNSSCYLKSIEIFVATGRGPYAYSGNRHELWFRSKGFNYYYVLPIGPAIGVHLTWTILMTSFTPQIVNCMKGEDIEEMFLKERGNDDWTVQSVAIHYHDWCNKTTLGPDHHHFNKLIDGDGKPNDTMHQLIE